MKKFAGEEMVGGIGVTVSMIIDNLKYATAGAEGMVLLNDEKIGILAGSIVAGLAGFFMLKKFLPKDPIVYSDEEMEAAHH